MHNRQRSIQGLRNLWIWRKKVRRCSQSIYRMSIRIIVRLGQENRKKMIIIYRGQLEWIQRMTFLGIRIVTCLQHIRLSILHSVTYQNLNKSVKSATLFYKAKTFKLNYQTLQIFQVYQKRRNLNLKDTKKTT